MIFKGQYSSIKHGQLKGKQNHKIEFQTIELTKSGRSWANLHGFPVALQKKGFGQQSLRQQTNDFLIKQINKNIVQD